VEEVSNGVVETEKKLRAEVELLHNSANKQHTDLLEVVAVMEESRATVIKQGAEFREALELERNSRQSHISSIRSQLIEASSKVEDLIVPSSGPDTTATGKLYLNAASKPHVDAVDSEDGLKSRKSGLHQRLSTVVPVELAKPETSQHQGEGSIFSCDTSVTEEAPPGGVGLSSLGAQAAVDTRSSTSASEHGMPLPVLPDDLKVSIMGIVDRVNAQLSQSGRPLPATPSMYCREEADHGNLRISGPQSPVSRLRATSPTRQTLPATSCAQVGTGQSQHGLMRALLAVQDLREQNLSLREENAELVEQLLADDRGEDSPLDNVSRHEPIQSTLERGSHVLPCGLVPRVSHEVLTSQVATKSQNASPVRARSPVRAPVAFSSATARNISPTRILTLQPSGTRSGARNVNAP